jgi:hypothetical protein
MVLAPTSILEKMKKNRRWGIQFPVVAFNKAGNGEIRTLKNGKSFQFSFKQHAGRLWASLGATGTSLRTSSMAVASPMSLGRPGGVPGDDWNVCCRPNVPESIPACFSRFHHLNLTVVIEVIDDH